MATSADGDTLQAHTGPTLPTRAARSLIGWLPLDQARKTMAGNREGVTLTEQQEAAIAAAHAAVASRPAGSNHEGTIRDLPPSLAAHEAALHENPKSASMFKSGWELRLVHLPTVRAMQPSVFAEDAEARVADVNADDLVEIAAASVPVPGGTVELPLSFDERQQTWLVGSANPNLRILGHGSAPTPEGVMLGFVIGLTTSYMNVSVFRGVPVLRDGYHRAYGFLKRGIELVPAFVRTFNSYDDFILHGMLPDTAYLGDRPPFLGDYLDDVVAADVRLPSTQRLIMVNSVAVNTLG